MRLRIFLVFLGLLRLAAATCPSMNQVSPTTWRLSFDTTLDTFNIEQVGVLSGYYTFSNINYTTMSLFLHWDSTQPGYYYFIAPSTLDLAHIPTGIYTMSGNNLSYAGGSSIWAFSPPINQITARSFTMTLSGRYTCAGLCDSAIFPNGPRCTDMCPHQNTMDGGSTCNTYRSGSSGQCDVSCSGPCYGPTPNMCCDAACASCYGPSKTVCPTCNSGYYLQPPSNPDICASTCPDGYYQNASANNCDLCDPSCLTCTGPGKNACSSCNQGYYVQPNSNPDICATTCPDGYYQNANTYYCDVCDPSCLTCPSPGQNACSSCYQGYYYYNGTCSTTCPSGYIETSSGTCARCSNTSLLYYNHTCVSSCPLTTYVASNDYDHQNECMPCYLGCDTCSESTQTGCLSCSEGYFYLSSSCNRGCPSDMYANPQTRTCEQCESPCLTCSNLNQYSCTSCPSGDFLLNGTCFTSCPAGYYEGLLGIEYQVPACLPKLILTFALSLTTDSRVVNIKFNYGISPMVLAICERVEIQIANTEIDPLFFVVSPVTESIIEFAYLGDQYYPSLSLLNVTIDLSTIDYNSNGYEQFLIYETSATIQLKEIYPFTNVETQVISATSDATRYGGGTIATVQAANSVTQGALSLSLIRLQTVGEIVQLMRFISITWPASVAEFYATSHIDPTSIVLPIDFTTYWEDPLSDRNYSIPRVFDEYEISPFFNENYNNEISNLMLWGPIVIICSLVHNLLLKGLKKLEQKIILPKRNTRKRKILEYCLTKIQKLNRLMALLHDSTLWNFLFLFILSIYQSGNLWALLNIYYSSSLLEPSTFYTTTSLTFGIIFFLFYLGLGAWILRVLLKNQKYLLKTEEHLRPPHLKKYASLFEDFNSEKRIQLFFLPLSFLRSYAFVLVIALMTFSPLTQIVLFWITDTAFILYLILSGPLKEKWMRRITCVSEILSYSCITFAFSIEIVGHYVDIDPATLNEVGFLFLGFSVGSTFAGGFLSFVQVIQIARSLYRYLKNIRTKKGKIHPIDLSEPAQGTNNLPTSSNGALTIQNFESVDPKSPKTSPTSNQELKGASEDRRLFENIGKAIRKLPPKIFEKGSKGERLYGDLRSWLESFRSEYGENETEDLDRS